MLFFPLFFSLWNKNQPLLCSSASLLLRASCTYSSLIMCHSKEKLDGMCQITFGYLASRTDDHFSALKLFQNEKQNPKFQHFWHKIKSTNLNGSFHL